MEYSSGLPSLYLNSDDLLELETLLLENTTNPEEIIEVDDGVFTREYEDVEKLLNDPQLPDFIYQFEIRVEEKEGNRANFRCADSGIASRVYLNGIQNWVENKKQHIERFTNRKKNKLRTLASNYFIINMLLILSILFGFYGIYGYIFLQITDVAVAGGISSILAVVSMFALWSILEKDEYNPYPYMLLNLRDKPHHPYFKFIGRIVAIVGGLLTIFWFSMEYLFPVLGL